jgi:hypothetical protein
VKVIERHSERRAPQWYEGVPATCTACGTVALFEPGDEVTVHRDLHRGLFAAAVCPECGGFIELRKDGQ